MDENDKIKNFLYENLINTMHDIIIIDKSIVDNKIRVYFQEINYQNQPINRTIYLEKNWLK